MKKPTYRLSEFMLLVLESTSIIELQILDWLLTDERFRYKPNILNQLRQEIFERKRELFDKHY